MMKLQPFSDSSFITSLEHSPECKVLPVFLIDNSVFPTCLIFVKQQQTSTPGTEENSWEQYFFKNF